MKEVDIEILEFFTKRIRANKMIKDIIKEADKGNLFVVLSLDKFNSLQTEFNEICTIENRNKEDEDALLIMERVTFIPCRLFDIKDDLNFFDSEERAKGFLADLVINSHKENINVQANDTSTRD